tara:strand:- start:79400 stop:79570 length:171 start_codon:yes stop_codon:yes gene_type:complete
MGRKAKFNDYIYNMVKKDSKNKKSRTDAYEKKLTIDGTLDDVLKISVPKKKEKETK